ncbi:hypothetical protein ACH5RR_040968 [Cinchona calisaya]|uniref:Uncharacterized protein n=1 Tax=Cinchona calisaya TaxID=153742 RepID=A0ABD2XUS7_9GENT
MFLRCLSDKPRWLEDPYRVGTPDGKVMESRFVLEGCRLEFCDRKFETDLIQLPITDFDLILGMDWLAAIGATIDCKERYVMFQMPGLDTVIFRGNEKKPKSRISIISAVKAFKA